MEHSVIIRSLQRVKKVPATPTTFVDSPAAGSRNAASGATANKNKNIGAYCELSLQVDIQFPEREKQKAAISTIPAIKFPRRFG